MPTTNTMPQQCSWLPQGMCPNKRITKYRVWAYNERHVVHAVSSPTVLDVCACASKTGVQDIYEWTELLTGALHLSHFGRGVHYMQTSAKRLSIVPNYVLQSTWLPYYSVSCLALRNAVPKTTFLPKSNTKRKKQL